MPLLFAALVGAPAHADLPASAAPRDRFALVVGSTRAGLGQRPLRWAGADAARVEQALLDVGGVDPRRITRLRDPTRDELLASFDAITASVGAAVAAGARPELIVYYSGHARTSGLDLGREQLAPRELEAWLEAVPASLRLVVLDACHAGGLDGIKGAEAAAPFAVTALRGEQTEGVAVLTSSTASELAQESDVLEGSYFTSHLVAGLRGAADADADQVVTLDELYRYTYDRTLISTSETAAGGQHPVLQTRLSGTGSVVMSRLGTSAAVTFAPQTEGRMLWARRDTARVEAEVDKPRGRALALGLPVGDYDVWVTSPRGRVTRCRHEVRADGLSAARGRGRHGVPGPHPALVGAGAPAVAAPSGVGGPLRPGRGRSGLGIHRVPRRQPRRPADLRVGSRHRLGRAAGRALLPGVAPRGALRPRRRELRPRPDQRARRATQEPRARHASRRARRLLRRRR